MVALSYVYDRANVIANDDAIVGVQLAPGNYFIETIPLRAVAPRHYFIVRNAVGSMWIDEAIDKGIATVGPRLDKIASIGMVGDQYAWLPDGSLGMMPLS